MSNRVVSLLCKCLTVAVVTVGLSAVIWIGAQTDATAAAQSGSSPPSISQEGKPFDQEQKLAELRKKIAGQETKPAEEVFKNIQILKGMPAGRLLKVMEIGYSRSLGVNCAHCHAVDQWEKDDKPTKQITRDMIVMMRSINNDLLKKIKHLKSENPVVNCATCHRGQTKPALDLPDTKTE
jgi:Photosynthetic reaction centre cytochrome C subunit